MARRGFHISDGLLLSTFDSADMDSNHTIDFKVTAWVQRCLSSAAKLLCPDRVTPTPLVQAHKAPGHTVAIGLACACNT